MDILELITNARKNFLAAPTLPLVKEFNQNNVTIIGIERSEQAKVNYEQLQYHIAHKMQPLKTIPEFSQIIGDSQLFSPAGTRKAQDFLRKFAADNPQTIFLYGYTGKYNAANFATDTNHLLSLMVDNKEISANRVLANIVDYHTPFAITNWPGVIASDNLRYYTLIYTTGEQASAKFGDDTPTTDSLTNSTVLCFEGGIQSLVQMINVLNNNIPVIGITGLRDVSDLNNHNVYDSISGKPFLSAAAFLQCLKDKYVEHPEMNKDTLNAFIDTYLEKHALTSKKAVDGETKPALWLEAQHKMLNYKIWEKLHNFTFININKSNTSTQCIESMPAEVNTIRPRL